MVHDSRHTLSTILPFVLAILASACSSPQGGGDASSPAPDAASDAALESGGAILGTGTVTVDGMPVAVIVGPAFLGDDAHPYVNFPLQGGGGLQVKWTGSAPGTYSAWAAYAPDTAVTSLYNTQQNGSGSVTVTAYGTAKGAPISGSFTGTLGRAQGMGPATHSVQATFSVPHP